MSKILELADSLSVKAVNRHGHPTTGTIHEYDEARVELAAEVEKLEAAFNDRVRVIEMQLKDKEKLEAEIDLYGNTLRSKIAQTKDLVAENDKLSDMWSDMKQQRDALRAELEEARKDAVTIDRGCYERGCSCYDIRTDSDGVAVAEVKNETT